MILAHRDHQRRLLELGLARVHLRAAVDEQPHGRHGAGARRGHERRLAARIGGVGIGAGVEQAANQRGATVDGGEVERRHAVAVLGGRAGAGAQQGIGDVEAIGVRRGVERGQAVFAGGIDVGLLRDQRAHGGQIAAFRRVHQRHPARGGRGSGCEE